ncbi:hypothetical protein ACLMJK_001366 [Lecanora helva]
MPFSDENRDLQRRVTQIGSGDRLRPLHLLGGVARDDASKVALRGQHKRPLPVNDNKLSFDPRQESPRKKNKHLDKTLPHQPATTYSEFLRLDQAGLATLASDNSKSCLLVAVKHAKVDSRQQIVHPVRHGNIVNLMHVYHEGEDEIFMVYELMDVSLRLVNSIAHGKWNVYEIAAVCKESMLKKRELNDSSAQKDVASIGYIMMELMEQETIFLNPGAVQLHDPERWQPDLIRRFLAATQTSTLAELSRVSPREQL